MPKYYVRVARIIMQQMTTEIEGRNPSDAVEAACRSLRHCGARDPRWQNWTVMSDPGPAGTSCDVELVSAYKVKS